MVSKNIRPEKIKISYGVYDERISDHIPLMINIEIKGLEKDRITNYLVLDKRHQRIKSKRLLLNLSMAEDNNDTNEAFQ